METTLVRDFLLRTQHQTARSDWSLVVVTKRGRVDRAWAAARHSVQTRQMDASMTSGCQCTEWNESRTQDPSWVFFGPFLP